MKKLTHFATALADNMLSMSAMNAVKGGAKAQNVNGGIIPISNLQCDEKRRERPGGGISTS